jgi:hypothetical protein
MVLGEYTLFKKVFQCSVVDLRKARDGGTFVINCEKKVGLAHLLNYWQCPADGSNESSSVPLLDFG